MDVNAHLSHASYMQSLNIQSAFGTIYPYAAELIMLREPIFYMSSEDFIFNSATAVLRPLVHEPHLQTGGAIDYTQNDSLKPPGYFYQRQMQIAMSNTKQPMLQFNLEQVKPSLRAFAPWHTDVSKQIPCNMPIRTQPVQFPYC